jgi:uncharacterized SAM-binding protein YcdF (DUF218 family)
VEAIFDLTTVLGSESVAAASRWVAGSIRVSLSRPVACLIVVLGSPNDELGNLSAIARERLTLAAEEYFRLPNCGILVTGGFGPHFNRSPLAHAEHARSFLLSLAVPDSAFADFALSSNTVEDALLALPIVERLWAERLVVVTSEFHIERARYIFDRVFSRLEIRYVGAPHHGPPAALRELADHEARALAHLRAARGSSRDPLAEDAERSG